MMKQDEEPVQPVHGVSVGHLSDVGARAASAAHREHVQAGRLPSTIQGQVRDLQARIFDERYFEPLWLLALSKSGCSFEDVALCRCDDVTLVRLCNMMWFALPDDGSIRRGPFFQLCDVAEHIFDDEEQ